MTIQIQTLNKTCNRIWSEKVEGGLGKEFGRNESYFMKVSYKIWNFLEVDLEFYLEE
jgi:hypothetical protein